MSEDKENLTGHNYDGIEEYDNPLPAWWLNIFLGTIIFGFIYWLHYEIGSGPSQLAELKTEMAEIEKTSHEAQARLSPESEDDLKKLLGNAGVIALGREIFQGKCAACHGPELQGIVGPNLVDDYWIHGQAKLTDILGVVRAGVPDKGMPAWEAMLKPEELQAVVIFVKSSYGTKPANPKAPQGEKVAHD